MCKGNPFIPRGRRTRRNHREFWLEEDEANKAYEISEAALILHPNHPVFLLQKADSLVELNRLEEAKDLLDNNVFIDRIDANYFILQSEIFIKLNKFEEAKSILLDAIEICEEEMDNLYLQLADVYELEEDYANVLHYLKKSIEENVENEEAFNRLWFCVELTETHRESVEFHHLILEEHPYCINAWYNISHAYSNLGEKDKAIEALEYVIAIDENFDIAYLDCAELYFEKELYEKALDYYLEAEKIFKQHKDTYCNIGMCYFFLDDQIKARTFFRKAIAQDNEYAEAYFRIAISYRKEHKNAQAEESFLKAISLDDTNIIYWQFGADFYIEMEDYEKSNVFLLNIISQSNSSVSSWVNMAMNHFNMGNFDEALETLDLLDDIHPNIYYAKCSRFLLLYRMERMTEALALLNDVLAEDNSFIEIIFEHLPDAINNAAIREIIEIHSNK
ncbi:MAG: tetratricopeptide repeat protein [Bacteroidetes bacterium]|nr:tetratricopeptide repeat protein [Bacteroidota bacterium]